MIATNPSGTACSTPVTTITTPINPSAPQSVTAGTFNTGGTAWSTTWTAPVTVGTPPATYTIRCAIGGTSCSDGTSPVVSPTSLIAGSTSGTLSGLTSGQAYNCYVIATNPSSSVTACSTPATTITTPQSPSAPQSVAAGTSTISGAVANWATTWTLPATVGVPAAEYLMRCAIGGTDCTDGTSPVVSGTALAAGSTSGTLSNLTPNKNYNCYIIAQNPTTLARTCSAVVTLSSARLFVSKTICASCTTWQIAGNAAGDMFMAVTDGQYMYKYSSGSWTQMSTANTGAAFLASIAMSADGLKIAVAGTNTYLGTSADGGTTFLYQASTNAYRLSSTIVTSTGTAAYAFPQGSTPKVTSNLGGTTFAGIPGSNSLAYFCSAASSDATKIITGLYSGTLYKSANSGSTFTSVTGNGAPATFSCADAASSADGSVLALVPGADGSAGFIQVSTDSGTNWNTRATSQVWSGVAMSNDGTKIYAAVKSGAVYGSSDSGTTWSLLYTTPGANRAVACSSDGVILIVGTESGGSYLSV